MQHSAKRLSRMASAMFQLSIGDQVRIQPHLERGDLQECMDQVVHEIGPSIEEKHIDLSVDLGPSPLPLLFDGSQMEQVLLNLLENACKFTPKAGFIEVTGYSFFWDRRATCVRTNAIDHRVQNSRKPNAFRIDIRDSGPGIPVEQLDSIFEQYTRYSGTQDRTGGGLGLAICKMLVSRHHGRVWAETSESGATFSLVIPFCAAESKDEADVLKYQWSEMIGEETASAI
jgi:signal transduction histidine kinase